MKFKINQEVLEIASGKKCIVVATKEEPWRKTVDPYNRKEVYPENNADYIVLIKIDENEYKGEMHVYEQQLTEIN
ncbi:hypothetical protein MQX03_00745 [Chryseobacterium aahli]|uniref:hypothetical protein n=1 Tax=Chryseobacterium aahli TaxID=1278643 RepID=UPI001F616D9C|nr:hypothetical protein [Chryseobacterium aahli]MCI3935707.1 hypothetical protein [Chryseobacterium aahli]